MTTPSLFAPCWSVTWRGGRQEFASERTARLGLVCVSAVLSPPRLVRLLDPAGKVVESLRWRHNPKRKEASNGVPVLVREVPVAVQPAEQASHHLPAMPAAGRA